MIRKLLLSLVLIFTTFSAFSSLTTLDQVKYRWRNDDGNEATATWKAAENTPYTLTNQAEIIRLRFEFYSFFGATTWSQPLSYSKDAGVTWTPITQSTLNDFIIVTSTNVTHNGATTNLMGTGTGGTYVPGKIVSAMTPSLTQSLVDDDRTEMEWVLQPTANLQNNTTYLFRCTASGYIYDDAELLTNLAGCVVPTVTAPATISRCSPGTFALTATSNNAGATITWWDAATGGNLIGTGASVTSPSYSANTTVYAQAAFQTCTSTRVPVQLLIEPFIINLNLIDGTHCLDNNNFTLTTTTSYPSTYTYIWSTGATTSSIVINSNGGTPSTYWIAVTSPDGCISSDTINATLFLKPTVNLGNDTNICDLSSITLNAGTAPSQTYLWSNGATTPTITVNSTSNYYVTVNNANCANSDSVLVTVVDNPVYNLSDTVAICEGDVATLDAGNIGDSYSWNTSETTQSITTNQDGMYVVEVTNSFNCSITDSSFIVVNALPIVDLGNDTTICNGSIIQLDAQNAGASYIWNTGESTQIISVSQAGTYDVTVTDNNGCVGNDDKIVNVFDDVSVAGFNFVPRFETQPGLVEFFAINPVDVIDYHWDFGDGGTSNLANPSHVFATDGDYKITLTVSNDCGSMDTSLVINVDLYLGVKPKGVKDLSIDVYPTAASNKITIESQEADIKIKKMIVYNALGQQSMIQTSNNTLVEQLDVTPLSAGNYIIHIETNKGSITRRFIVTQ